MRLLKTTALLFCLLATPALAVNSMGTFKGKEKQDCDWDGLAVCLDLLGDWAHHVQQFCHKTTSSNTQYSECWTNWRSRVEEWRGSCFTDYCKGTGKEE
jgi:hypothetical protein